MTKKALEQVASEYLTFPIELLRQLKATPLVFIHAYPNLDTVLQGGNLLARGAFEQQVDASLLVCKVSHGTPLKAGAHVFVGAPQVKGVAKGFVHSVGSGRAYIGGMGGGILK